MKIIFDIGCNEGQNLEYYLKKADYVVGIEANPYLTNKIKTKFKKNILEKKLFIENATLSNKEKKIIFFINKKKNYLSQVVKPKEMSGYRKINVKTVKTNKIIKKYLNKFNLKKIEFIKLDIESSTEEVLEDMLNNKILPKFLSVEAQTPKILELILKSNYKSFKFINGSDIGTKLKKLKIINKLKKRINHTFQVHSAGPYGMDISGKYYSKNSLVSYFLNSGFGWKDINCYINKSTEYAKIEYNKDLHKQGFKFHFEKMISEFFKSLKNKFNNDE